MDWFFTAGENWLASLVSTLLTSWLSIFSFSALQLFSHPFVTNIINAFHMLGCVLFSAGFIIALLEYIIEASNGQGDWTKLVFNTTKGVVFTSCFAGLPYSFFMFTNQANISMSYSLTGGLYDAMINSGGDFTESYNLIMRAWQGSVNQSGIIVVIVAELLILIFDIKILLDNVSRAGVLFALIIFGSLNAFSIPRGHTDATVGWCKQVIGLCLTNTVENILMITGFYIFSTGTSFQVYLCGVGAMFAATLVPKIAQQFSIDASVKDTVSRMAFMGGMALNTATRLTSCSIGGTIRSAKKIGNM